MIRPSSPRLASLAFLAVALSPRAAPAQGAWTPIDSVVAVVNQDVVLKSELDRRIAGFKASLDQIKDPAERSKKRIELSKQVVSGLVDERLLHQEAARMGIGVHDQEVDRAIAEIKAQNKLDDAALNKALISQGFTMAEYRAEMRNQIVQAKVVNLVLRPRIQIGEEQLRAAYKEAQKRDPKGIGKYEEVKEPLAQRLFEDAMQREQMRWLAERRADAFIEVRGEK